MGEVAPSSYSFVSTNENRESFQKYDRDPFVYWKKHRQTIGNGDTNSPSINFQDVERRANRLDLEFKEDNKIMRQLEEMIEYEDKVWGEGKGEVGNDVLDDDKEDIHRERYQRYDTAKRNQKGNGNGTHESTERKKEQVNVNELVSDVNEAKILMRQLEELVGMDDDEEEEEEEHEHEDEDEYEEVRQSRGGRQDPRRKRYVGEGEWQENSDAPSPSKTPKRKTKITRNKTKARRKRIPSTMTRRSREVDVRSVRRRDSVGTRVRKGVDKLNRSTSLHGRVAAALDLARNVV